MKHDEAPESSIAQPWNGFIFLTDKLLGAVLGAFAEKYKLRGDTFEIEEILKHLQTESDKQQEFLLILPKWELPLTLRRPRFPTLNHLKSQHQPPSNPFS